MLPVTKVVITQLCTDSLVDGGTSKKTVEIIFSAFCVCVFLGGRGSGLQQRTLKYYTARNTVRLFMGKFTDVGLEQKVGIQ